MISSVVVYIGLKRIQWNVRVTELWNGMVSFHDYVF